MQWKFVAFQVVFLYTACVYSNQPDFSQINLKEFTSQLPPGLLPPQFSNPNITLDDAKKFVQDKCMAVAKNSSAYDQLEEGVQKFFQCIAALQIDPAAISEDIAKAAPTGDVDTVFAKLCSKKDRLVGCIEDVQKAADVCLEPSEIEVNSMVLKIIKKLLDFACYKGGDQIALFFAEGGPECLMENEKPITACVNTTFSKHMQSSPTLPPVQIVQNFTMKPEDCKSMDDLQDCLVNVLEKCKNITPANIVESMFKYVRNETQCPERSFSPSHTPHWTSLLFIIGMAVITRALTF